MVQVMLDNNRLRKAWKAGHKYEDCVMDEDQREVLGRKLVASARDEWQRAKAAGMDTRWNVIEQVAHEFHTEASGMDTRSQTRGRLSGRMNCPRPAPGLGTRLP